MACFTEIKATHTCVPPTFLVFLSRSNCKTAIIETFIASVPHLPLVSEIRHFFFFQILGIKPEIQLFKNMF